MPWIATAEECREMDRQAESLGISIESLMHEAGRAVAASVLEHFSEAQKIVVLCGKGNNGGDGLVAARLLAEHQRDVEVLVAAPRTSLNPNAQRELGRLREPGITPIFEPDREWKDRLGKLKNADLIVDALLGTGSSGAPQGAIAEAISAIGEAGRPVLAVDIPSGIEADYGTAAGAFVRADRTVTFGLAKPFAFQSDGLEATGAIEIASIGFPESMLEAPRSARLIGERDAKSWLPSPAKGAHKGSEGHVLIVAGQDSMPGAAVLSARGALRAGAGLVTVSSISSVCRAVSQQLPEAIFLPLPDKGGRLGYDALNPIVDALNRADALVIGPGIGALAETGELLDELLKRQRPPTVVDADALNLMATGVDRPVGACVLTPHPGEAGRLLGMDPSEIQSDRFSAARALAKKFDQTALLKGAFTIAAEPNRPLLVNPTGNPGMASPGVGDVLSGVIGALLAKGLAPGVAAALGAYWHGLAGDLCSAKIGSRGFLASELADMLPKARATIAST